MVSPLAVKVTPAALPCAVLSQKQLPAESSVGAVAEVFSTSDHPDSGVIELALAKAPAWRLLMVAVLHLVKSHFLNSALASVALIRATAAIVRSKVFFMLFKNKLKKCVHLGTKIQIISDMTKSRSKNLHYL